MQVSFFDRGIFNEVVTRQVNLADVLTGIKTGVWKDHVENVRRLFAEGNFQKKYQPYVQAKEASPNITTSGTYDGKRSKATLIHHSGFIDIDIDGLTPDQVEPIKAKVMQFPFVAAAYASISGRGVCAVCSVPASPELHESCCNMMIAYFFSHGIPGVDYLKDWSRARFISYDPGLLMKAQGQFRMFQPSDIDISTGPKESMKPQQYGEKVEYYSHQDRMDYAWKCAEKAGLVFQPSQRFDFAKDVILHCSDMGVPAGDLVKYFEQKAPEYKDFPKMIRSFYAIARPSYGTRKPVKTAYKSQGFRYQGKGNDSFIPVVDSPEVVEEQAGMVAVHELADCLIWESTDIDFNAPKVLFSGGRVARDGDQVVLSGQSKTGKGGLVKVLAAGMLLPDYKKRVGPVRELMEFVFAPNPKNYAVIVEDTEQSRGDVKETRRKIQELAGLTADPRHLVVANFKRVPPKKRAAYTAKLVLECVKEFGGVFTLFLDGTADLIPDVNDMHRVSELYHFLEYLAEEYKFPIFNVIHKNPGRNAKERGHLGSEFRRKCATLISTSWDASTNCSWVSFDLMRKGRRGMVFPMQFDAKVGTFVRNYHMDNGSALPDRTHLNNENFRLVAQDVFFQADMVARPQLESAMVSHFAKMEQDLTPSKAAQLVEEMAAMGFIENVMDQGRDVFTTSVAFDEQSD